MPNTSEASRARTDSVESIAARSRKSSTSMMNDLLVNARQEECGTSGQKRKDSGDDSQTAAAAAAATRSRKTSSSCMMDPPSTTASAAGPVVLLQHRAGRPRTRTNSVSSLENEEESLKQQRKMSQDSSISASSAHLGIPHDSTTDPSAAAAAAAAPRQRNGSLSETGTGNSKSVIDALLPSQSFEDVESLPLPSHVADGPSFEDADSLPLPPLPLPPPPSLEPLAPLVLTGTTDDATLTPTMSNDSSNRVKRSKSGNASVAAAAAAAALEHLDALGGKLSASEKEAAATALSAAAAPGSSAPGSGPTAGVASMPNATTKGSLKEEEDEQSSAGTQTSSANQRLLYEAIMMTAGGGLMSTGGGGGAATIQGGDAHHGECGVTTGRERLESIGSFLDVAASFRNRDRLESWGGMSDLSLQLGGGGSDPSRPAWLHGAGGSSSAIAAAAAATASTETNAAANAAGVPPAMDDVDLLDLFPEPARSVPSRISMARDRLNSVASLSEGSFTGFPILVDGVDMTLDVQAFVAAAMASVGDQLAELAGAVESAASLSGSTAPIDITAALAPLVENAAAAHRRDGDESETSSAAEPMIGAALEGGMGAGRGRRRPRSWSASSGRISVDYEAVAQAVDAAHAATGAVDVASIANSSSEETGPGAAMPAGDCSKKEKPRRTRRQLPLKRSRDGSDSDRKVKAAPTSKANEDIDQIRERARAAAGYVPPQQLASAASKKQEQTKASVPLKKRAKRPSPNPDRTTSNPPDATPRISNKTSRPAPERAPSAPLTLSADVTTSCSKQTKGQTNQKWDSMFECLVEFINERREEETTGQSEEDKNAWVWDGNVPTTHKAKDGKAIGRWVNNQRSAKGKGSLKGERLQRLESIGLKWSVLVSNSWNDAFGELQKYSDEQKKAGKEWDGNVPTNYQIKANPNGSGPQGEDRNLGRWVNRQRSLYQSGKLRKDRQLALEKMGLKWSMLASTSWESMYETFCEYVQQKKTSGVGGKSEWDGNVPATYRTNDNPPRSLGRWINRQRSAKMKNSLKKEYVDKLNAVGLKWSVHERCSSNDKQGEAGEVGNVGSCDGEKKPAFPPNGNAGECKADNVESSDVDKKPPPSINNKQGECKSNDTDDGGGCASVTNGSSNDKDCENKAGSDVSGGDAKTAKDSADDPQGEGKANHSSDVVEKNVSAVSVTKGKEN
jgi:Helicase associated domain